MQDDLKNKPLIRSRWAVSFAFGAIGMLYASWAGRLPLLTEMYSLSDSRLSTVLLALALGALVAMPLTGLLIVKTGSRLLTVVTLPLYIGSTLWFIHSPSAEAMLVIGFVMGLFNGSIDIAMNAQAILVEERMGKPIMSSFHGIFSAGMLLGAAIAAAFSWARVSLSIHMMVVAGLLLIAWLVALPHFPQDEALEAEPEKTAKRWRLEPTLLLIGFIAFCCMMGEGAMSEWTALFLEEVAGTSRQFAALGVGAFAGAMMIGRFGGDWARARYGSRFLIRAGAILSFFGLLLGLAIPHGWLSTFSFMLVGLGLSNIVPIAYSIAGTFPGIPAGVGISTVTSIGYAGFLIGPVVIGYVSSQQKAQLAAGGEGLLGLAGLQAGLGIVLVLFLLMTVVAFVWMRRESA